MSAVIGERSLAGTAGSRAASNARNTGSSYASWRNAVRVSFLPVEWLCQRNGGENGAFKRTWPRRPAPARSAPGRRGECRPGRLRVPFGRLPVTVQPSPGIVRLPRLPFSRLRSSFGCLRFPFDRPGCRSVVCGHRSVVSVSVRSPRLPFSRLRSPFDRPGYRFDRSGYCSVVSGYAVTVSWPSTDAVRSVPCALSARRPGIPSPRNV
jgi:hypothetical protein